MTKPSKRKGYHHGDLRRALCDAAVELIAERGIHALSLREAARRAQVSSGAPYRHFADKEALLVAIAQEAGTLLAEHTAREVALVDVSDPVNEFRARGIAYVTFAAAHPVHFRLLCSPDILAHGEVHERIADQEAELVELVETANLGGDASLVALAGRSLAYGLARLIVDDQLEVEKDPAAVRELAVRVLDLFGGGIGRR